MRRNKSVRPRAAAGPRCIMEASRRRGAAVTFGDGSSDGRLYALDAAAGTKKWTHETEDKILGGANWTKAPGSDSKWILVGSYDFSVYCLEALTGKVVWKLETENFINGTPAVTSN